MDDVGETLISDATIVKYGELLIDGIGVDSDEEFDNAAQDAADQVRQKLRKLAHFLLEYRVVTNQPDLLLKECLEMKKFEKLFEAAKAYSNSYKAPHAAEKLRTLISKYSKLLRITLCTN